MKATTIVLSIPLVLAVLIFFAEAQPSNNSIITAALRGDWKSVGLHSSELKETLPEPAANLLAGYASMAAHEWYKAWRSFSAVDNSNGKQELLGWAEELCKTNPASATAFLLKGDALARLGRYDEAAVALNQTLQIDPKLTLAYDLRGLVEMFRGSLPEAAAVLRKALERELGEPNTLYEQGLLDIIMGDFEESAGRLTYLLNKEPNFFLARNARGVAFLLQGKFDMALQDFDEAARQQPSFEHARNNKVFAALLRARGLFSVDVNKVATLSPKGVLGARATANLFYAGAGINSPDGGQTLEMAKLRAGADPVVIQIRERDYVSRGLGPNNPRLATEISTLIGMKTREAQAAGKNLVVSVVPNLENYRSQFATEYMYGAKEWNDSKAFCSLAMDSALRGFRQAEPNGKAIADVHSFHGDAFSNTRGPIYDVVNAWKIRTGGNLDSDFANRCRDYVRGGAQVNLITGRGDYPSLWNAATKSTADRLSQAGLVTSYYDRMNDGHGIPIGNTAFDISAKGVKNTVVGSPVVLTAPLIADTTRWRSGVFMKLGDAGMDVRTENKTDLSFLRGNKQEALIPAQNLVNEPDISYPFLIFNPDVSALSESPRGTK